MKPHETREQMKERHRRELSVFCSANGCHRFKGDGKTLCGPTCFAKAPSPSESSSGTCETWCGKPDIGGRGRQGAYCRWDNVDHDSATDYCTIECWTAERPLNPGTGTKHGKEG